MCQVGKKQAVGIALILFGMLLVLVAAVINTCVPIMPWEIAGVFSFVLVWLGLLVGILGVALSLSRDNSDK